MELQEDRYGGKEIKINNNIGSETWYSLSFTCPSLCLVFVWHNAATQDGKLEEIGFFAPPEIITYKTSGRTANLHVALYLPNAKVRVLWLWLWLWLW